MSLNPPVNPHLSICVGQIIPGVCSHPSVVRLTGGAAGSPRPFPLDGHPHQASSAGPEATLAGETT